MAEVIGGRCGGAGTAQGKQGRDPVGVVGGPVDGRAQIARNGLPKTFTGTENDEASRLLPFLSHFQPSTSQPMNRVTDC